jgi:hypothetical protein
VSALRRRPALVFSAALLAWGLIPLAWLAVDVLRFGGVLSGSDGALPGADQLFYMSYVRESGSDVLISNEFRLGPDSGVLFHPMFFVSGVLWQLGVGVKLALLAWKPVAALALGVGIWRYAERFVSGRARVAVAVLAAFYFSPVLPALEWGGASLSGIDRLLFLFTSGESMPALQLWGYLHAALVVGLVALFLLGVERLVAGGGSLLWTSAAGLVVGWLHPWQGVTLLAVLLGLVAWGRFSGRYRVLALPALAVLVPMVYLFVLGRADADWRVSVEHLSGAHAPVWILLAALAPLVVPALAGVRLGRPDDGERMLLLWAAAAFAVYVVVDQFPFHALQGLSIPLAVLAVRGWQRRVSLPAWVGVACVAALTLPGMAFMVDTFREQKGADIAPYVLQGDEARALRFLESSPRAGGVLSRYYLGMTVPALAGRDTWVGHFAWTPDFESRRARADDLFAGRLGAEEAQALVRSARPAWLLADCRTGVDLAPLLGGLVVRTHRFGCAAVYEVELP